MKARLAAVFSILALILVVLLSIPTVAFDQLNGSAALLESIFQGLVSVVFAFVGALIAVRRPANPIGPLISASALVEHISSFALGYATYGLVTQPGSLSGADWLGTIGYTTQSAGFSLMYTFVLLLFPTGHLPSPRWRPVGYAAVVLITALALVTLFGATADNDTQLSHVLKNPMAVLSFDVSNAIQPLVLLLIFIVGILSGFSLIVRSRRATGIERQQIKWLGYAALLCVLFVTVLVIDVFVANGTFAAVLFSLPPLAIALATGISILRYRLFDIDVIINRTLVYGVLTLLLAVVYFGGVIGAQTLINALSGRAFSGLTSQSGQQSPVVVVVTTLVVAALFQPLRRRVQHFIDRRFYRSRYDTRKTLDQFGTAIRNDVELAHLTESLLRTVQQTMQPVHVSLWLRAQPPQSSETA
jgi:hypothetical protein